MVVDVVEAGVRAAAGPNSVLNLMSFLDGIPFKNASTQLPVVNLCNIIS